MGTITLANLRNLVRWRSDTLGLTTRHPDSNLNTDINASWQSMRELVSDNGHQLYLANTTGTMTPGPLAGFSFGTIQWPTGAARIYAIDVTVAANDIRSLDPVPFSQRNDFRDAFGQSSGIPVGFHVYNIGSENATGITSGTIAVFPAPTTAYPYAIWYLPQWVAITNDAYVFNGMANWEDWVVWDCVVRLASRDNNMANTYQIAIGEREKAEQRLLRAANSVQRVGPGRRVDIAARSRWTKRLAFWRYP